MFKYSHAYEKLVGAIEIMATSKGSRRERLYSATYSYVMRLQAKEMPPDLAEPFNDFMAAMTNKKDPNGNYGDLRSTAENMHWKTADRLSKQLLNMYLVVNEARDRC